MPRRRDRVGVCAALGEFETDARRLLTSFRKKRRRRCHPMKEAWNPERKALEMRAKLGAGVFLLTVTFAHAAVSGDNNWVFELPTVEDLMRASPPVKDNSDSRVHQAAAMIVLDNFIRRFSGTTDESQMVRGAKVSYLEYLKASCDVWSGPKLPVWQLAESAEFSGAVLSNVKTISFQSRQAFPQRGRFTTDVSVKLIEDACAASDAVAAKARGVAASDADARTLALEDGLKAKGHADTAVFGVPLGAELTVPDCESVGQWKRDPLETLIGGGTVLPKVMVSPKTCLLAQNDETSIHWGDAVLPKWAQSVKTNIKDGVLLSVTIVFDSAVAPPPGRIGFGPSGAMAVAVGNNLVQAQYEKATKSAAENVAKAQKDLLRKYGKPRSPVHTASYTNGRAVQEPEWIFPGLHVRYASGTYQDSILIEVESLFRARSESQQTQEAAEPKL